MAIHRRFHRLLGEDAAIPSELAPPSTVQKDFIDLVRGSRPLNLGRSDEPPGTSLPILEIAYPWNLAEHPERSCRRRRGPRLLQQTQSFRHSSIIGQSSKMKKPRGPPVRLHVFTSTSAISGFIMAARICETRCFKPLKYCCWERTANSFSSTETVTRERETSTPTNFSLARRCHAFRWP